MTFTFVPSLNTDLAKVRFHIGDTSDAGHYLEDETITALLTSEGSVGAASIACIKYILTQLASPDFEQDWMSVSKSEARKGMTELLRVKRQEFGLSDGANATATIKLPYRRDSDQYASGTRTDPTNTNTTSYDGD